MIVKFLGTMDIVMAFLILLLHFGVGYWRLPLLVSLYLFIKGGMFYKDVQSYVDMFIGVFVWIIFLGAASFFDYILMIYLLQKGIASFM